VWMGGRDNQVTAAEKNLLEANGYTVLTV